MRLGLKVLLGFFLIVALAAYLLLDTFLQEVKPGVKQGMEVAVVDTANLLAELAAEDLRTGRIQDGPFAKAVEAYRARILRASIYGVEKRKAAFRVYVTDGKGILRYDSEGASPGADYSQWNDVLRTLRGEYGARSTRTDPGDESTSTMVVGAPIREAGRLVGVLSVATPTSSVVPYAQASRRRVWRAGLALLGACLAVGAGLSLHLSGALGRLRTYAKSVAEGGRPELPRVGSGELGELARAVETMREKLEDRAYVERYVATLTHEMKSPLSAIRGAAELMEEDMPEEDRRRFLRNIREQEARLRSLLERMLDQAVVEQRRGLQDPVALDPAELAAKVLEAKAPALQRRGVELRSQVAPSRIQGEAFLLEQALSNLVDNALAFSPEGGILAVMGGLDGSRYRLAVRDQGPGLPDFALARAFEPFFSLPSPATGRKGTGLGLRFVKEVAELHGGEAGIRNLPDGGAEAWIEIPRG